MKRFWACLMVLCLCFSFPALAEQRIVIRWEGGFPALEDAWDSLGIEVEFPNYHLLGGMDLMTLENAPDVYSTDSAWCDVRALKEADLLADLSESEKLRSAVDRMWPEVQELLTDGEGRILALPMIGETSPVYWQQEAWDAAGLSEADVPQSYTELLDFAQAWAERVAAHPEKRVCFTDTTYFGGGSAISYTRWLMDVLLSAWEMQAYEAGETPLFDTPDFVALLERTRDVGKQLAKAEPSQKKREKMLSLFWNVQSSLPSWFNGGRDEGFSHTVPFRITREQPVLMRASVSLYLIHKNCSHVSEIVSVLERLIASDKSRYAVELYRDGGALAGTDKEPLFSEGWIQDRMDYTGHISFAPLLAPDRCENEIIQFCQGKLSAEELAEALDRPSK